MIRNLTRSVIVVEGHSTDPVHGTIRADISLPLDPTGPAFVEVSKAAITTLEVDCWDIEVVGRDFGPLRGLPDEVEGTWLLVSAVVAAHPDLHGREDILVPGKLVRDSTGRIVSCRCLKPGQGNPV